MTLLAPHLTTFLRERLPRERRASEHTIDAYAYAFQLLLTFAAKRLSTRPSALEVEQLDASLLLDFLGHLEAQRGNSARTRNARLAAIKSFFRFLEYRVPACVEQVHRILAIPAKKADERLVPHLTREEMQTLLDAPDPRTRAGVRDRALLHLAFAAGLRVSELVGLQRADVTMRERVTILVRGKGRRERTLPLWKETTSALRAWLAARGEAACEAVFVNARGEPLTRSGFEYILAKYVAASLPARPSLGTKRVSPHVLRHTCAMHTLQATRDIRKVALWLGHARVQTTEIYVRADPGEKLDALDAVLPPSLRRGRFRAPDKLLASLRERRLCGVTALRWARVRAVAVLSLGITRHSA
jgi:integrase/recombinase XerD